MGVRRPNSLLRLGAGAAALLAVATWMAGWCGPGVPSRAWPMLWVLLTALPLAALWVAGAAGVGVVTARLLLGDRRPCVELQLALGVAVMLWLDAALGRLGVLSA
ncbi:MAG: hypothetical protein ACYTJ0_10120, partial [Planctomycetota bacterium]